MKKIPFTGVPEIIVLEKHAGMDGGEVWKFVP